MDRDCAFAVPERASLTGTRRIHGDGQRHVRRAALRRPLPHQRSVRRRRGRRPGDRHAGAARQGTERRGRRRLAAACGDRHRPHRADAAAATPRSRSGSTTARSIRTSGCSCPKLSPYTTAVASGSIRDRSASSRDVDHLLVDGTVDRVDMRLFDYAIRNAAPIRLALDRSEVKIRRPAARRRRHAAAVDGHASACTTSASRCSAVGRREPRHPAGVLPRRARIRPRRRSPPRSTARCSSRCSPAAPRSPTAASAISRCRTRSTPSTARIHFDSGGIRLDDVTATMGGGRVQFGGRIGFDGYLPGELNVTVARRRHAPALSRRACGRPSTPICPLRGNVRRRRSAAR